MVWNADRQHSVQKSRLQQSKHLQLALPQPLNLRQDDKDWQVHSRFKPSRKARHNYQHKNQLVPGWQGYSALRFIEYEQCWVRSTDTERDLFDILLEQIRSWTHWASEGLVWVRQVLKGDYNCLTGHKRSRWLYLPQMESEETRRKKTRDDWWRRWKGWRNVLLESVFVLLHLHFCQQLLPT